MHESLWHVGLKFFVKTPSSHIVGSHGKSVFNFLIKRTGCIPTSSVHDTRLLWSMFSPAFVLSLMTAWPRIQINDIQKGAGDGCGYSHLLRELLGAPLISNCMYSMQESKGSWSLGSQPRKWSSWDSYLGRKNQGWQNSPLEGGQTLEPGPCVEVPWGSSTNPLV